MAQPPTRLIVFAGLPGTGKTTLARAIADEIQATFLRIDTFEAAITSTLAPVTGNPVGYVAAEWVAEDQLRAGRSVVIDACNNLVIARNMWNKLAARTEVPVRFVEVVCSEAGEHRRRVESRTPDRPGQGHPSWADVRAREWEPFVEPRILVDNLGDPAAHIARLRTELLDR